MAGSHTGSSQRVRDARGGLVEEAEAAAEDADGEECEDVEEDAEGSDVSAMISDPAGSLRLRSSTLFLSGSCSTNPIV